MHNLPLSCPRLVRTRVYVNGAVLTPFVTVYYRNPWRRASIVR